MGRLVVVDPSYGSTVGHHGEVNRPLLAMLKQGGWNVELWADVALEAEAGAPEALRGVFSGCGYVDPSHWRDLMGMVQLGRRVEQQMAEAAQGEGEPVAGWLAHSLLPFQLLGLARHLAGTPSARVLISVMFAPGETLAASADDGPATAICRVALAALASSASQQGHRLTLAFSSRQQEALYAPLLAATGLEGAGLHPPVVGAGCQPASPPEGSPPLVLLHWGDLKPGKGREVSLEVLEAVLERGVPEALRGWGWLFHVHCRSPLPPSDVDVLTRAEDAGLGLEWLQGEVESAVMHSWLARCPLALLAYDPVLYGQRSSGLLWQWTASRAALGLGMAAVGHGHGWLAAEAMELGVSWFVPAEASGLGWLEALQEVRQIGLEVCPAGSLSEQNFASWCLGRLKC